MAESDGEGDFATGGVQELTGHPARSFEIFARDFAQALSGARGYPRLSQN